MTIKRILYVAAFFLSISFSATADTRETDQTKKSSALETLSFRINEVMVATKMEGAAVALVNKEGVFWAKGFGYADKEAAINVTPKTLFRAGSTGKSITSLIAMRLVEEGRLDLMARLRDIAPEVVFTNKWESETPVRLVHLLEHTTGWDDFHLTEYRSVAEGTGLAEGLKINPQSRTSRWPPGYYPSYSNSGPAVMGYVLEKITGQDFNTLAQRHVFQPLGIEGATFLQTEEDFERLAKSYTSDGELIENTRLWAIASGAGAISVEGLGRLVQLYIRRGEVDGIRLLSPTSIKRIETPASSLASRKGLAAGYGLGNYPTLDWHSRVVYRGHDGGLNGFQAVYAYQKEMGIGFAILVNSQSADGVRYIQRLIQNYLQSISALPSKPLPAIDSYIKNYEGLYQAFTPRIENTRFMIETFNVIDVRKDGNQLLFRNLFGEEIGRFMALGGGRFAPVGAQEADRIFYKNEKGQFELSFGFNVSNSSFRKVSPLRAYGSIGIIAFFGITSVLAILFTAIWGIGRCFGKFPNSHRWRVWTFPMLSILAFIAGNVIAVVPAFFTPNAYEILGTSNLVTRSIQISGILFALFAILAVFMLFRARNVFSWARWHAGITTVSLGLLAALVFYYDLIGQPTWAYAPVTYERYIDFW